MAEIEFVLQGFTSRTSATAVRDLFAVDDVERVTVSVAFVTESGVSQIEPQLHAHKSKTTVFAGIRNDITSYQGMAALKGLSSKLFAVDTGARTVVFHPKIYMVRALTQARLLIGSSNLTLGGMNNNVEAGLVMRLDLNRPSDRALADAIEKQLYALPTQHPKNIVQIATEADLDELLVTGRILDEMATRPPKPSTSAPGAGPKDATPRIRLKVAPLRRPLKKATAALVAGASSGVQLLPGSTAGATGAAVPGPAAPGVGYELVWESKELTRRDLNIPVGSTTNATGSINLDKGLLPADVDHRHYFRDDVFSALSWTPAGKTVEVAQARFLLVLRGIGYGEHDLVVRHTTSTNTTSYKQLNAMSRLSWGPFKSFVAKSDLIGRTLSLYRDRADPGRFILEID
jgi:HKD family nuclease